MLAHQNGCWLSDGVLQALTQGRGPPALAEALYAASGDLPHGSLEAVQSRLDPVDVALESAGGAAQVRGLWTTLVSMVVNLTVHRVPRHGAQVFGPRCSAECMSRTLQANGRSRSDWKPLPGCIWYRHTLRPDSLQDHTSWLALASSAAAMAWVEFLLPFIACQQELCL